MYQTRTHTPVTRNLYQLRLAFLMFDLGYNVLGVGNESL